MPRPPRLFLRLEQHGSRISDSVPEPLDGLRQDEASDYHPGEHENDEQVKPDAHSDNRSRSTPNSRVQHVGRYTITDPGYGAARVRATWPRARVRRCTASAHRFFRDARSHRRPRLREPGCEARSWLAFCGALGGPAATNHRRSHRQRRRDGQQRRRDRELDSAQPARRHSVRFAGDCRHAELVCGPRARECVGAGRAAFRAGGARDRMSSPGLDLPPPRVQPSGRAEPRRLVAPVARSRRRLPERPHRVRTAQVPSSQVA